MSSAVAEVLIPPRFSAATQAGPVRDASLVQLDGRTMGTSWRVSLASPQPSRAGALRLGIEELLAGLNAQLSHWQPSSSLCRYNRAPAGSWHRLPSDFCVVLEAAQAIAKLGDGALDITAGPLVDAWGFGPPGPRTVPPSEAEIAEACARTGWQRLPFDGEWLQQPGGIALDCSAIAKGHAVDAVADWLNQVGLAHHLVEIGGELRGQGVKPDGSPWWVAIDVDPAGDSEPVRIALDGLAVATSGDRYRHYSHQGQSYAHTLDPRSGRPLIDPPIAVTVIHPLAREADGWATALTVLGPDRGIPLATRQELAVRYLLRDGHQLEARCSPAWAALAD